MVRPAHLARGITKYPMHTSLKCTMAKIMLGPFGIYSFNLRLKLNQILFSCHCCNLQTGLHFAPEMAGKYVKVTINHQPYEMLSIDLLGPYHVLPYPTARKQVKVFALAAGCQTFGGVNV